MTFSEYQPIQSDAAVRFVRAFSSPSGQGPYDFTAHPSPISGHRHRFRGASACWSRKPSNLTSPSTSWHSCSSLPIQIVVYPLSPCLNFERCVVYSQTYCSVPPPAPARLYTPAYTHKHRARFGALLQPSLPSLISSDSHFSVSRCNAPRQFSFDGGKQWLLRSLLWLLTAVFAWRRLRAAAATAPAWR